LFFTNVSLVFELWLSILPPNHTKRRGFLVSTKEIEMLKFKFVATIFLLLLVVSSANAWESDSDTIERFDCKELRKQYDTGDDSKKVSILTSAFKDCWQEPGLDLSRSFSGRIKWIENSGKAINKNTFTDKDILALPEAARLQLYEATKEIMSSEKYCSRHFGERLQVFKLWLANAKSLGKTRQLIEDCISILALSYEQDDLITCLATLAPLTSDDYTSITKKMLENYDAETKAENKSGNTYSLSYSGFISQSIKTSDILYYDLYHNVVKKRLFPEKEMARLVSKISEILPSYPETYSEPEIKYRPSVIVYQNKSSDSAPYCTGKLLTYKNPGRSNAEVTLRNIYKNYPNLRGMVK
jgi:hypothetical protein